MLCTIRYVPVCIARAETGWISFELEIIKKESRYFSKGYWEKLKKKNGIKESLDHANKKQRNTKSWNNTNNGRKPAIVSNM